MPDREKFTFGPETVSSTAAASVARWNQAHDALKALKDKILGPTLYTVFSTEERWGFNPESDFGKANEYAAAKAIAALLDRDEAQFSAADSAAGLQAGVGDSQLAAAADQMEADLHSAQTQFGIDGSNVDPQGTPDPAKLPPPTPIGQKPTPHYARESGGLVLLVVLLVAAVAGSR